MIHKLLLAVLFVLTPGLAVDALASTPVSHSEFISGDIKLEKCFKRPGSFCYVAPGAHFGKYSRAAFTPVEFRLHPQSEYHGIAPANFKLLSDMFHRTLIGQLEPDYRVVISTNANTVVVRVALTDIKLLKTYAGNTADINRRSAQDRISKNINLSDVKIETEFLDGETGERIAVQIDSHFTGKNINNDSWEGIRAIFKQYAGLIKSRLLGSRL